MSAWIEHAVPVKQHQWMYDPAKLMNLNEGMMLLKVILHPAFQERK